VKIYNIKVALYFSSTNVLLPTNYLQI